MSFFSSSKFDSVMSSLRDSSVQKNPQGKSLSGIGGVGSSPLPSSPYASREEAVVPVVWHAGMCGGFIKGTGEGVICADTNCSIGAHKVKFLAGLSPGDLFIPAPTTRGSSRRCFVSPRLSLSDFPEEIQTYLKQPRSVKDLTKIFGLVNKMDFGELLTLTSDEVIDFLGGEAFNQNWTPSTPAKLHETAKKPRFQAKLDQVDESPGSGNSLEFIRELEDILMELVSPVSPSSEDLPLFFSSEWPKIQKTFTSVVAVTKSLCGELIKLKDHSEYKIVQVLSQVERNMTEVFSLLGDFDKQDASLSTFGLNVSSVLAGLATSLLEMQELLGTDGLDDNGGPNTKRRKVLPRIQEIEDHLKGSVSSDLEFLASEIQGLQQFVKDSGRSGSFTPVDQMEEEDDHHSSPPSVEYVRDEVSRLAQDLAALQESFNNLTQRKERLTGKESPNTPLKFGGIECNSLEDAAMFLVKLPADHGKKPGYFFDVFSLGTLCDFSTGSVHEKIANRGHQLKGGLSVDDCENAVLFSFESDRPSIIGGSKDVVKDKNEEVYVLPKVKTLADWSSTSEYDETVMKQFSQAHEEVDRYLSSLAYTAEYDAGLLQVSTIAAQMLFATRAFLLDLNTQIDAFYRRITQPHLGTTDKEAWSLISEMLAAVFEEIYRARNLFGASIVIEKDMTLRTAKALFCTYGAHKKMLEIKVAGFTKHPCVVPALSLHLFSRKASVSAIKKLEERIIKLEKTVQGQVQDSPKEANKFISRSEFDKWKVEQFEKFKKEINNKVNGKKGEKA